MENNNERLNAVGYIEIIIKKYIRIEIVQTVAIAIVINIIMECFSRRSLMGLLVPLISPAVFLYNVLILVFTLSIALFFRRKIFTYTLVGTLWVVLAVIDCVVRSSRKTPFTAMDFYLIKDALKIMPVYMNWIQIALVITGAAAVIAGLVFWWFKAPKRIEPVIYPKAVIKFLTLTGILFLTTRAFLGVNVIAASFGNLGKAYNEYGFAYCFSCSILDRGISKPDDYSEDYVDKIIINIKEKQEEQAEEQANIIFLQLESFMNPNLIKGVTYSENPIPNFERLMKTFSSGYLYVPCVGAGTANTEFEIQTGMNMDDFGPGEYPYRTVMQGTTCESAAYNLKSMGYTAHAIHNNDATFYDRNKVFSHLGYDTFTAIEYMDHIEKNTAGWAKDKILTEYILKVLDSTEKRDYVYAISVQGHGDYPSELEEGIELPITAEGFFESDSEIEFNYYINQLKEMDEFIEELIEALSQREERTVLVMYGDHLPGFEFDETTIENEDIFQTQYIIWDNFGLERTELDIEAYQLSSHVLEKLDISAGMINKYHQVSQKEPNYLKDLTVLEYDILYGNCDAYGGENPFMPTQLQMGIEKISIEDIYIYREAVYIEGHCFNEYSVVNINGKEYVTEFIHDRLLKVEEIDLKEKDIITVAQKGKDKAVLSKTKPYIY